VGKRAAAAGGPGGSAASVDRATGGAAGPPAQPAPQITPFVLSQFAAKFHGTEALAARLEACEADVEQLNAANQELKATVDMLVTRLRARPASVCSTAPVSILAGHSSIAVAGRLPDGHAPKHGRDETQQCSCHGLSVLLLAPRRPAVGSSSGAPQIRSRTPGPWQECCWRAPRPCLGA